MRSQFDVRPEAPADAAGIRALHERAFDPSPVEAQLVEDLRADGDLAAELCLVAHSAGEVIGHIAYSRARLDTGAPVLALAPMAVLPEHQRAGVGRRLAEASLQLARATDFALVAVLGHPEYYPRFGFEPAAPRRILYPGEVPGEAWMMLELPAFPPGTGGRVEYAPALARLV